MDGGGDGVSGGGVDGGGIDGGIDGGVGGAPVWLGEGFAYLVTHIRTYPWTH